MIVGCGDLTILLVGLGFHCFLLKCKEKLRHSLGRPSRSDFVQPEFDVYEYDLGNAEIRKEFQFKWDAYYARLSQYAQNFKTSSVALLFEEKSL
ncbi:MAG: hypothetical protein ACLU9T_12490 [Blautia faecis]